MLTALNHDGTQASAATAPPPSCDVAPSPVPTPGDVRVPAGHARRHAAAPSHVCGTCRAPWQPGRCACGADNWVPLHAVTLANAAHPEWAVTRDSTTVQPTERPKGDR